MNSKRNRILCTVLVFGLLMGVMGAVQASPATSPVGVVDYMYLIDHHPDTPQANEALKAEEEQDKQQFTEKSASLSDQDKQALAQQLEKQLEQKRLELLKPIAESIDAAIKKVADAKGLSVVMARNSVVYGGVDITDDVLKVLGGSK